VHLIGFISSWLIHSTLRYEYVRKNGPAPRSGFEHTTRSFTAPKIRRLFSWSACNRRRSSEAANPVFGSAKQGLCTVNQLVGFFAYFCCCNRKCVAMCCSCRRSCAWHVQDLRSCAYAPLARLQFLLHYLALVTVGCSEHVANGYVRDRCGSFRRNRLFLRLLFRVELCGSDRNDFGVFEHARS
jgi:hypothetical protein